MVKEKYKYLYGKTVTVNEALWFKIRAVISWSECPYFYTYVLIPMF